MPPRDNCKKLYEKALAADNLFSRELARVYGKKNAGDARYKTTHADARVNAASRRKKQADRRLLRSRCFRNKLGR